MGQYNRRLTLNLVTSKQLVLEFHFELLLIVTFPVSTILLLFHPHQQLAGLFHRGSNALHWLIQHVHLRFVQHAHYDLALWSDHHCYRSIVNHSLCCHYCCLAHWTYWMFDCHITIANPLDRNLQVVWLLVFRSEFLHPIWIAAAHHCIKYENMSWLCSVDNLTKW